MPSISRIVRASTLAAALCVAPFLAAPSGASFESATSSAVRAALCPIVYPVDQATYDSKPGARGIHFLFYGNGFFINKDGYLITAAHVLSQLHGGQPYILLPANSSPARIVPARLVAVDGEHDIAILRAIPNPFLSPNGFSYLPLSPAWPEKTSTVTAAALYPQNLKDPHTGDALLEKDPTGEVLDYEFSALYRDRPETELFLFRHEIEPGQSGSPVIAAGSDGVVGLVEGRWLRENATTLGVAAGSQSAGIGAVVPIHYAIWLLQQRGIAWQPAPEISSAGKSGAAFAPESPPKLPAPLSLVSAPYPQSLTGGEVVLDVLIDTAGRIAQIRVIRGEDPFLMDVLAAVRTWTFLPAHENGRASPARVAIAFQFPQSLERGVSSSAHAFNPPTNRSPERAAVPILTVEPAPRSGDAADGSVILYESLDAQGAVTSTHVVQGSDSLTPAAEAAARQWRFSPALRASSPQASAAILVFTFRRSPLPAQQSPSASTE
jgi:Trypsin-like peptidase domain/Gram-negative bacterial TonB protein C-terminal